MLAAKADFIDAGEGNLFGLRMSIRLALSDSCFKQIDEHKQYAHAWRYMLIQCLQTGWAGDTCFSYSRSFLPLHHPKKHWHVTGKQWGRWKMCERRKKSWMRQEVGHTFPQPLQRTQHWLCVIQQCPLGWKKKIKKIKRGTCSIHKFECTLQSCAMDSP